MKVILLLVFLALALVVSAQLMGGLVSQPVSECAAPAEHAVNMLSARSNAMRPFRVREVVSCKTQVVAGIKYYIDANINQAGSNHVTKMHFEVVEGFGGPANTPSYEVTESRLADN